MIGLQGWLITHDNCLDGATAGLVGEASGLTPIFVEPDRVVAGLDQITDNRPIYLADVSLKPEDWTSYSQRIRYVLDHHQSALKLQGEPNVLIDQARSGAHLMYDYAVLQGWIMPTPAWERLCLGVERYDLWKPRHEWGQNINRLFHHLGYDWYRERFGLGFQPYNCQEGKVLSQVIIEEERFIQAHLKTAIRYDYHLPYPLYGVRLQDEGPTNNICHTLIERGAALVLVVKPDKRLSARSDARVDAARLMEDLFQGGGHARAAGGRLNPDEDDNVSSLLGRIGDYLNGLSSPISQL